MKQFVALALVLIVVVQSNSQVTKIEFEAPAVYPEGVVFDRENQVFYVSSVHEGTIGQVDEKGNYTAVYRDSTLKSTFGMKLSPDRRLLWICAGDPSYSMYRDSVTFRKMIRLIALEPGTWKKIEDIDLSRLYEGRHFANDLAFDDKGNIYITDSYSPVIYKVDAARKASVFAQGYRLAAVGTGLNGIVFHPGGYLLTVNGATGSILKIERDNPGNITKVWTHEFFPGADGLLLDENNNLVLVQNKGVNRIFKLASKNEWKTAELVEATRTEDRFSFPSTATFRDANVWVMNAKLNELSDSTVTFSRKFSIQQARFVPAR